VYACAAKDGPALEKLMDTLREEFSANPPVRQNSISLIKNYKVFSNPLYNYCRLYSWVLNCTLCSAILAIGQKNLPYLRYLRKGYLQETLASFVWMSCMRVSADLRPGESGAERCYT
jgi:hypothetical protein